MSRPVVVLGDLHLTRHSPDAVLRDLSRLLVRHSGARIAFDGDLFDFSADPAAVHAALDRHADVRAALGSHLEGGGEIWLVSGNHDAEVGDPAFVHALGDVLQLTSGARARVRATPWFFREGGLHLEHGHLFDPDNAPAHPLVRGAPSLGVHFVEEFVAPAGAHRYLNANDGTPLELFLSSFAWYGPRAPYVVYRYFHAAFRALGRAGPFYRAGGEAALGRDRIAAFAEAMGIDGETAIRLSTLGPPPTLASLSGTFTRLYFDRVFCTLAIAGGLGAALAGRRTVGATLAALGGLAMGASWAAGYDRYRGSVSERLAAGALAIAETSGAELVVFGHTHLEDAGERYANTGSFAFPRHAPGRPYLVVDFSSGHPRAERRYLEAP